MIGGVLGAVTRRDVAVGDHVTATGSRGRLHGWETDLIGIRSNPELVPVENAVSSALVAWLPVVRSVVILVDGLISGIQMLARPEVARVAPSRIGRVHLGTIQLYGDVYRDPVLAVVYHGQDVAFAYLGSTRRCNQIQNASRLACQFKHVRTTADEAVPFARLSSDSSN